jgi:hypothetical protein
MLPDPTVPTTEVPLIPRDGKSYLQVAPVNPTTPNPGKVILP